MSSKESKDRSSSLIKKVSEYCWSKGFISIFTKYFENNADVFIDAPPFVEGGEHDLRYYTLFEKYLVLYEDTLTDYLNTLDISIETFYRQLRELEEQGSELDWETSHFIDCLIASTTYESFYRVMQKLGRQSREAQMLKAESKSSNGASDKYGGDTKEEKNRERSAK